MIWAQNYDPLGSPWLSTLVAALPLAATVTTERVYRAFLGDYSQLKTFFHGHSYTGNQLGCAVALANLNVFRKERTLTQLRPKIAAFSRLLRPLAAMEHVGDIRQQGTEADIGLGLRRGDTFFQQPDVDVVVDRRLDGVTQTEFEFGRVWVRLLCSFNDPGRPTKNYCNKKGKEKVPTVTQSSAWMVHHGPFDVSQWSCECKEKADGRAQATRTALFGKFMG